ncbi:tripartite motif-containing protein 16-like protein [Simochromis diagramma]|uniref:tripartite motif-containing protein 16-like protein n=1 Tax=Simochromis diagramma TaxID=43689 RepID=UPI001A7EDA54|nr:tripartite motif-containing protein 16-like protein [Simochromis diagramma]
MAERNILAKMNHLCCQICRNLLRNPVMIPCGHNFCMRCIQDQWDCDPLRNSLCRCPECKYEFPSRPQLIKNTTLAEVVRETEMSCNKEQQSSEGNRRVLKRPRSCAETSESTSCGKHNKPLEVYCCTDKQIIYAQCASAEHGGHRIGLVKEERRQKEKELKDMQTKFKQTLQKQERKREMMGEMLGQIQDEARKTEAFCESVIVGAIDSLQKHYLSVKEVIAAQEEAAAAQVRISLKSLEEEVKQMKERDAKLDRLAQTESHIRFLQKWPSLKLLCDHSFQELSEDPLLHFELTKRAVEHLGKQLEEFCDKEFASICNTADGEKQQESASEMEEDDVQRRSEASVSQPHASRPLAKQKVEPKTREEFLQYACELSLDPTTAHEDLVILKGGKMVKLCNERSKNPSVRNPEKFIHRRQVLCREGLQADCYYEVEVKGDKAEIALTYKGIDRKSRTTLSAFGANANSWSLDLSKHYSVSHNSDSIQLTTPPRHHRVGIYLKFQTGTLSFYEVSDSMNFLYKVEAEFREPLYPGFWLGEKCCIRICDLRQSQL